MVLALLPATHITTHRRRGGSTCDGGGDVEDGGSGGGGGGGDGEDGDGGGRKEGVVTLARALDFLGGSFLVLALIILHTQSQQ